MIVHPSVHLRDSFCALEAALDAAFCVRLADGFVAYELKVPQ